MAEIHSPVIWMQKMVAEMRGTNYSRGKTNARSALDQHAITLVRAMRKCSRLCPAFILCPLMPLAVQPKKDTDRICLVNCGDDRLKVAYYKMFVGGQEGVVQMLQTSILEYGDLLKKSGDLTNKERLHSTERLNMMLERLHKIMSQSSKSDGNRGVRGEKSIDDEMDEVILIASQNEPKPDPESLEHSPMLDELIRHDVIPNTVPKDVRKQPEVDLGKELLDKFFPQEDE